RSAGSSAPSFMRFGSGYRHVGRRSRITSVGNPSACNSRSQRAPGSNRVAEGPKLPSALLATRAGKRVEGISQLDVDEPGAADHRLPPCARQGAGDSTGPEIDITKRLLRDGALKANVRNCHTASRPQHPKDLSIDPDLVRAEVDHAVGDHDIRPAILDRQIFDESLAKLDIVQAQPGCHRPAAIQHLRS